ncbi:MAG: hypothetical protein Ct9H90mP19_0420 [Gammaproteobacteria bacterium]|nr:MAG: hypothetical protein Ct9H90mP19_0420 [Gammaproteobacteria bacterium]
MKFIKYLLISLVLLGGLSFGLFQITGVQDFLTKRAVQQQMQQQENIFPEDDALSAIVWVQDHHFQIGIEQRHVY